MHDEIDVKLWFVYHFAKVFNFAILSRSIRS